MGSLAYSGKICLKGVSWRRHKQRFGKLRVVKHPGASNFVKLLLPPLGLKGQRGSSTWDLGKSCDLEREARPKMWPAEKENFSSPFI